MILAILRNSSLRHNPSFLLILNLTVSDVGVGLICQSLATATPLLKSTIDFSQQFFCSKLGVAVISTAKCLVVVSFLTITAISFDRFLAVHLKFNYRNVVTVTRMKVVILLLWLVALLSGMLSSLDHTMSLYFTAPAIFLCLFLTAFNYLVIAGKLYNHNAQLNARNKEADSFSQHKTFSLDQYKKTLKSMLYVYGAFLMCYLPYFCCAIALKSIGPASTVRAAYFLTATFVIANSAINPCLYYWRIEELRQAVRKLLKLSCLSKREATRASTATSDSFV